MSTTPLTPRTLLFARVLGPFFFIIGATTVARASEMRSLLTGFESSPVWSWVTGAFILLGGLVVIGLHQHWRGAAAIIVSTTGWLLAVRGLLLLAFPRAFMAAADATIGMTAMWSTVSALLAAAGLYLAYAGWRPAPIRLAPKDHAAQQHLPRAA